MFSTTFHVCGFCFLCLLVVTVGKITQPMCPFKYGSLSSFSLNTCTSMMKDGRNAERMTTASTVYHWATINIFKYAYVLPRHPQARRLSSALTQAQKQSESPKSSHCKSRCNGTVCIRFLFSYCTSGPETRQIPLPLIQQGQGRFLCGDSD